jgi:Enterobacteriaceae phage serine recombinase
MVSFRSAATGIGFCSISDNIDTTTPTGKLVFHITGAIAEFERVLISERTKAGLEAARRNGKILGRPRRLTKSQIARARFLSKDQHVPMAEIAAMMKVGKTTVWRAINDQEQ